MGNGCQNNKQRAIYVVLLTAVTLGIWWIGYLVHRRRRPEPASTTPLSESIRVVCEPQPQRNRAIDWISLAGNLAAVVAVLVAVGALYADIQEVQQMKAEIAEMQQYNRLSTVPHVAFARVLVPTSSYPTSGLYLINYGPGLAILETYTVYIDDDVVPEGWEAATRMLGLDGLPGFRLSTPAKSLPPGHEFKIMLVGFETDSITVEHRDKLADSLSRLRIEVTYRSVYGEEYVAVLEKRGRDK